MSQYVKTGSGKTFSTEACYETPSGSYNSLRMMLNDLSILESAEVFCDANETKRIEYHDEDGDVEVFTNFTNIIEISMLADRSGVTVVLTNQRFD